MSSTATTTTTAMKRAPSLRASGINNPNWHGNNSHRRHHDHDHNSVRRHSRGEDDAATSTTRSSLFAVAPSSRDDTDQNDDDYPDEQGVRAKRLKTAPRYPHSIDSSSMLKDDNKNGPFQLRRLQPSDACDTNDEIHSSIDLSPVLKAVLDTPPMQRLRYLKQLGVAEYVYMNVNHSRFEHSVGVAKLAGDLAERIHKRHKFLQSGGDRGACYCCTPKDILCVQLAGLLHDLGHGPFSHTYERFVGLFQSQEQKHHTVSQDSFTDPDPNHAGDNDLYESFPPPPKGWRHEDMSLQLIDIVLEYLGLAIDFDNLDEPLKQIGNGIDRKSFRCFEMNENDCEAILTSRDWIFIKELIWGGPIAAVQNVLRKEGCVGREQQEKEWYYMIVNNAISGLDVDKLDYMARDARRAFKQAGEIQRTIIKEPYLAWVPCQDPDSCHRCKQQSLDTLRRHHHLRLCYPKKMTTAIMDFFKERPRLHKHLYLHKTAEAANLMICDIFLLADPFFFISTQPITTASTKSLRGSDLNYSKLPISRAMLDTNAYLRLRDSVIDQISSAEGAGLKKAHELICRWMARDLYKFVGEKILHSDKGLTMNGELGIKQELLAIDREHSDPNSNGALTDDDLIVTGCSIHHGRKDQNPLESVHFIEKHDINQLHTAQCMEDLPLAHPPQDEEYLTFKPVSFQERSVRVFCRDRSKVDRARHVFEAWKHRHSDTVGITPALADDDDDVDDSRDDDDRHNHGIDYFADEMMPPPMLTQDSDVEPDTSNDEDNDDHDDVNHHPLRANGNQVITPPRPTK